MTHPNQEYYRQKYLKYKQKSGSIATQKHYNKALPTLVGQMKGVKKIHKSQKFNDMVDVMSDEHWNTLRKNITLLSCVDLSEVPEISNHIPEKYQKFLKKPEKSNKGLFHFLGI